jgi:hypothetical protein
MGELSTFMVHTVAVETLSGGGPMGDTYSDPTPVPCFVDEKRRYVRDSTGNETVSETTLWVEDKTFYDAFTPGSVVTHRDKISTVIGRSMLDSGALELPDHLEISLA